MIHRHVRHFEIALRLLICALAIVAGCARRESIPVYPDLSTPRALQILAERSRSVKSVSAQALVTLTRPDGQTIRLDAALVMRPPDAARMRAYKFGQAVFDLTLSPDGAWMLAAQGERRERIAAAGSDAGRLTREWLRLLTGLFDDPAIVTEDQRGSLIVREKRPDGTTVVCHIDRSTLTARRYELLDEHGRKRFTLTLSDYADFHGVVWPRRIDALSDAGRILIELRDVEINEALPEAAFHHPARAEKLP